MKTDHLTKTDGGNISILISYPHYGEHTLPQGYHRASVIYDQMETEDILQLAFGYGNIRHKEPEENTKRMDEANQRVMLGKINNEVTGYYKANHTWDLTNLEPFDTGTIIRLEFKHEDELETYINLFELVAANIAFSAGGDDDFFDYMPGFIDIFAQLCEVTKQEKRYAKFIKDLIKNNPHDTDYEFYRNTITTN